MESKTLSLCVIAYNEEAFLPNLLRDIEAQQYPHEEIELVLVDGASTDGTKRVMEEFAAEEHGFYSVQVLDNPKRIQAAGWNAAISHATGDVIARIDAHTSLPPEYSVLVMANILQGEDVVGGMRPCRIEKDSPWARVLLQAENSLFGSSINASRRSTQKEYVKTMFHAAYRREVFETVGLFNEELLRTEDNEIHFRIRQAGYRLLYDPAIVSYQYARSSLRRMLKQKYGNGYWVGRTLFVCPGCLSLYHFVPAAFVAGIAVTTVAALFGLWQPAALMWGLYLLFCIFNTIVSIKGKDDLPQMLLLPVLFLLLHCSYGIGTWTGLGSRKKN